MLKTRVIPCLLLKDQGLVKTVKFKDPKYVGDPINAVRIFNDKEVDELILLDITASMEGRKPDFDLIAGIASECFMPLCYGGGIKGLDDISKILSIGVEKVSVNSSALQGADIITRAASRFGSQSVVLSVDIKKGMDGQHQIYDAARRKTAKMDVVEYCQKMEAAGAGEILLNSVDRDGTMEGYDIELIKKVSGSVNVPVIACGGAGKPGDFFSAVSVGGAAAVAAGSLFVFQGKYRAVLISYPSSSELEKVFNQG
ncbi:MAG: imidazole glycerol phosphate synthase subunit HisF [Candidatus Aureabacteria bacterium]|nr:imidazole glycerol phosphate synthase subunit HisF [Candidatus Auribacterota bacterium]